MSLKFLLADASSYDEGIFHYGSDLFKCCHSHSVFRALTRDFYKGVDFFYDIETSTSYAEVDGI
jgi:hypothetical protein